MGVIYLQKRRRLSHYSTEQVMAMALSLHMSRKRQHLITMELHQRRIEGEDIPNPNEALK